MLIPFLGEVASFKYGDVMFKYKDEPTLPYRIRLVSSIQFVVAFFAEFSDPITAKSAVERLLPFTSTTATVRYYENELSKERSTT